MLKGKPVKISVIGVGHVGSVVGFNLARSGLANEIVLCARDGNGGMPLSRLGENRQEKIAAAEEGAKNVGVQIFGVLGHTTYAVAMAVEMIVANIVKELSSVLPVSVLIEGFCGARDVCLSLPCIISDCGIRERLEPELNEMRNGVFGKVRRRSGG
jgi:malate/lactate dehydrogenase